MLDVALNMDINTEIERRIRAASRLLEESKASESKSEYDQYYDSQRSNLDESKKKKRVKFESPERFSSVQCHMDSSASELTVSKNKLTINKGNDNIDESIKIEESYSVSQSMPKSVAESRKTVSGDMIQESIKESK